MSGGARVFDVGRFASAEEAIFAALLFLLNWHHEDTGMVPGRGILTAVVSVLEELMTRGRLPGGQQRERLFLGRLLAILEQIVARDDGGFLSQQVPWIRRLIFDAEGRIDAAGGGGDDPDDDDGGDGGPNGNDGSRRGGWGSSRGGG